MRIHDVRPAPGSKKRKKRAGRGISSGLGKTAGRGHKGQKARSGGGKGPGFEGGQTPLQRRLPKRGFNNVFKKDYAEVKLEDLNRFSEGTTVTPELLFEEGLIKHADDAVKLLGNGELERALTVKAHAFTRSAAGKVEAAGGKTEVI